MFLEKFAKLQSKIEGNPDDFKIIIYDDEFNDEFDNEPVMYLTAHNETSTNGESYLYVPIVDSSKIYFKLPENRQHTAASVLLKRFIKYYRENFPNADMPVAADFANYDLQEKFKVAVERGIFPKKSLELSGFTTKEEYENPDNFYNMKNRKRKHNELMSLVESIKETLNQKGIEWDENRNALINYPVNNYITLIEELDIDYFPTMLFIGINNGNLEYALPVRRLTSMVDGTMLLNLNNPDVLTIYGEDILERIRNEVPEVNFNKTFEDVPRFRIHGDEEEQNMSELYHGIKDNNTIAAKKSRLHKRG